MSDNVIKGSVNRSEKVIPIVSPFRYTEAIHGDHRGAKVEERVLVSGTFPPGYPQFVGHGILRVQTPHGDSQEPFIFPIDGATTLDEAFARFRPEFERHAQLAQQRMMESQAMPQLLIPGVNVPANMPLPPAPRDPRGPGLIIPG